MRRLIPIVLACLLASAAALPVAAAGSFTKFSPPWVGAQRNGETWTPYQYCFAGYVSTFEYRCAWEFNLDGIPSGSIITAATLNVTRTSGDCSANNCPVLLHWFDGNGGTPPNVSDVDAGSSVSFSWTPTDNSPHTFNVLDQIRDFYARGRAFAGFNLRASGPYGLYQFFDPNAISLAVSYGKATTLLVEPFFNGGTGRVFSTPSGIKCPDLCGRDFADGTTLTLTAEPDAGSAFSEWRTGPCAHSTKLTCSFDMPSTDLTIAVTFVVAPPPTSTPSPTTTATSPPTGAPTARASSAPSAVPTAAASGADASGDVTATAAPSGDGAGSVAPTLTASSPGVEPTGTPDPGVPSTSANGGIPLPIVILLLIAVIVIGGGGFWLGTRRRSR